MYLTKATINNLDETATRPIVIMVAQDIRKFIGINNTVPLRIGDAPGLLLNKDSNGSITHTPDIPDEELFITYTETGTNDYDIALTQLSGMTTPIYKDVDVRSSIKPILTRRTLTLSVTYYSKSKSQVTSLLNRLRLMNPNDRRYQTHNIEYFYYVPEVIIELLSTINTLKNAHTVPPVDLDDYIANTFTTQANVLNSESGNSLKLTLGIRTVDKGVIGTIDSDVYALDRIEDTDTNRWGVNIDYSIEYEMPTQLLVSYPIVIYNQPVPAKFRLEPPVSNTIGNRTRDSAGLSLVTMRQASLLQIPDSCYYLRIPNIDALRLPQPDTGYSRLFSVITVVDIANPTLLMYLDELPGITFKADVLALIKLEANRIGTKFKSIFHIDIFNYDEPLYTHTVIATVVTEIVNGVSVERVKLTTDLPLNVKDNYRVTFNVLADLITIPSATFTLLKNNIDTIDATSPVGFSVVDTVMSIFDLDMSKLAPSFIIDRNTTSMEIALNIRRGLWNRVFTKQTSFILTGILEPK